MNKYLYKKRRAVLFISCFVVMTFITSISTAQEVDPLSGRAIVNIPLGKINALDLSVGVSLSHHGGALQVNEGPGNAGMGWQVSLGGYIAREVRGLPDDYSKANDSRTGWLANNNANANLVQSFTPNGDDNLSVCSDEAVDWTFMTNLNYVKDSEPDVFYINAPGLSGKFVFGADGLPKLIPFQDVQITYVYSGTPSSISSFSIKTNKGLIYTFSTKNLVTRQAIGSASASSTTYWFYSQPLVFASSWSLTSIESKVTGALANFSYVVTPQTNGAAFNSVVNPSNQVDTLYFLQDKMSQLRVSQATLKNFSINLNWTNNLVDKISINESESADVQEFDLIYRSITSSSDNDYIKIAKPFLTQVRQQNSSACEALPSYRFEYTNVDTVLNQVNIPWRTGYGEDFFGFYNGQDNNQNIPTLYYYQGQSGGNRFRVTPITGTTATQVLNGPGAPHTSTTMVPNSAFTSFGALKKIQFPTGGTTTYTYELNKYWDSSTNEELVGPGVRLASVNTFGGEVAFGKTTATSGYHSITKTYQYLSSGNSQTSGRIIYPPSFGFTDGASVLRTQMDWGNGAQVFYGRVKESVAGQGNREYIFDLPNMYPDASGNASKSRIARPSGVPCANSLLMNGPYTYPFAPLKDLSYTRGLPTSIAEYDSAGNLTYQKTMSYSPRSVAGTIVKGLRYELIGDFFQYSLYEIPVNESRLLTGEVVKTYSETDNLAFTTVITAYQYNSNNLLTQSTVTNSDGSIGKSFVRYASDFIITSPTPGDQQANAIYKLNTNNRTAEVIETYSTFTPAFGTEAMSGAQLILYKDHGTYVWPYQTQSFVQGATAAIVTNTTSTSTSFTSDTNYKVKGPIMDFVNGLPINQTDPLTKITSGTHYATGTAKPLATFANCKAENAVYEGFELVQDKGLTYSGTGVSIQSTARTGKKSLQFGSTNSVVTSTATLTKRGTSYRVSSWMFAAQSSALTIDAKNGATVQSSVVLNYTTPNQWQYIEGFMVMTSVSPSFTLQLSANNTIQIDDFVALPKQARVSYVSFMPLTGVTAQTNDRGNSVTTEYDAFGRPVKSYDRQRNLREAREYVSQRKGRVELSSNFSSNVTQYNVGKNVTFTASVAAACLESVTYAWTITDFDNTVVSSTGNSINYLFPKYGTYSVKLTASTTTPGYAPVTTTENICVTFPDDLGVTISVDGSTTVYYCDPVNSSARTFTAVVQGIPPSIVQSLNPYYTWYVTTSNGTWVNALDLFPIEVGLTINGNQLTRNSPQYNYQVTCVVRFEKPGSSATPSSSCNQQEAVISPASNTIITFVNNSPCP